MPQADDQWVLTLADYDFRCFGKVKLDLQYSGRDTWSRGGSRLMGIGFADITDCIQKRISVSRSWIK